MLSREQIEERLNPLETKWRAYFTGLSHPALSTAEQREREALETAKWLGDWLERAVLQIERPWCAGDESDCPRFAECAALPNQDAWCVRRDDEARAWLEGEE